MHTKSEKTLKNEGKDEEIIYKKDFCKILQNTWRNSTESVELLKNVKQTHTDGKLNKLKN